jgi:two-component system response regulator FlrC
MDCRILVVDDDRTVRNAIAEYLDRLGYQTDAAEDAKTAMAKMKAARYDIVVLEVNLPRYSDGYSGRYLLSYIHNRYSSVKTIVVTGDSTIETGLDSLRLGAICWIAKPFSLKVLRDKISAINLSENIRAMPNRRGCDYLNY